MYADKGAIDPGAIDARREFNWWFDPEGARIVLRAPWKKVTITPVDISVKTRFTTEMKATIAKAHTPVTEYLDKYSLPGYMWDEIAGAALIDPSIITGQKQLYMDIDVDHGASYGKTIFWDSTAQVPPYMRLANVQFDINAQKFYKLYMDFLSTPQIASSQINSIPPQVTFRAIAYGNTYGFPQTSSFDVTLVNLGTGEIQIQALHFPLPEFSSAISLPFVLNPGKTKMVRIDFKPTRAGQFVGDLQVLGAQSKLLTTIPLSGTADCWSALSCEPKGPTCSIN